MTSIRKKAFTLIELLVVIAIIALLAAIMIPGLTRAIELANRSSCASNLKSLSSGQSIYKTENSDRMPYFRIKTTGSTSSTTTNDPDKYSEGTGDLETVEYDDDNEFEKLKEFYTKNEYNNLQMWYYLVHKKMVEPKNFQCPSDKESVDLDTGAGVLGFESWSNISYGLQTLTARDWHSRLGKSSRQEGSMVIAGDKPDIESGETPKEMASGSDKRPSATHGFDFINLLTVGASVKNGGWKTETKNVDKDGDECGSNFGVNEDDIFDWYGKTRAESRKGYKTSGNAKAPNDTYLHYKNDD